MLTSYAQRRTLYEGARRTWSPEAAATLVEVLSFGSHDTRGGDRAALHEELESLERAVLARQRMDASMRHLRWACIASPLPVLLVVIVKIALA